MDIITNLAGHGININEADRDAWRGATESRVFPFSLCGRNRSAFAYTVNIIDAPVLVTYTQTSSSQRDAVRVLPIKKAEAERAGLIVGTRMSALIIMLSNGFQQVEDGHSCWYESNGALKGVTAPRPLSLLAMPEKKYQVLSRNLAFPYAAARS